MTKIDALVKALDAGKGKGEALQVEDLNISHIGLYRESEVDITDPDVVEANIGFVHKGERLYYKKSEGKVKTFNADRMNLSKEKK